MERFLEFLKGIWIAIQAFFDPRPRCWGCKELLGANSFTVVLRTGPGTMEMGSYEICDSCTKIFSKIHEKTSGPTKSVAEEYD